MDMDKYNAAQAVKDKEAKELAKLAKYRQDVKDGLTESKSLLLNGVITQLRNKNEK